MKWLYKNKKTSPQSFQKASEKMTETTHFPVSPVLIQVQTTHSPVSSVLIQVQTQMDTFARKVEMKKKLVRNLTQSLSCQEFFGFTSNFI